LATWVFIVDNAIDGGFKVKKYVVEEDRIS